MAKEATEVRSPTSSALCPAEAVARGLNLLEDAAPVVGLSDLRGFRIVCFGLRRNGVNRDHKCDHSPGHYDDGSRNHDSNYGRDHHIDDLSDHHRLNRGC